jgi:Family of unknown function (DUF6279)
MTSRLPSGSPFRWLAKAAALILFCLALQACSAVRLAYSQAPSLAQWRIDSYLDLSGEQAARVRSDMESLHRWHQQVQLPRQLAQLRDVQRQLAGDLSPPKACATYEAFSADALELLARAEPTLVWLALDLKTEQIDHLQRHQARQRAKATQDEAERPAAAERETRFQQWVSRSETLYGRLDESQKAALRAAVDEASPDVETARAWRLARDQDVVNTLRDIQRKKPPVDQASAQVRALMERVQRPVDPVHRALVLRLPQDSCTTFARLHNTTTFAQRQAAARTLAAYEADFRPLVVAFRPGG